MLHIAVQVKELVSSNLNSMVEAAGNPVKMLRLLQRELEEYIIALQGDLSKAQRRQERLDGEAAELERSVADWTGKAQLAMTHKREDLARAALLTREQATADADRLRGEAGAAAAEARELARTVAALEAKLAETRARLAEETLRAQTGKVAAVAGGASRGERFLDRVATLEKRVDFVTEKKSAPASVETEIEQLRRDAKVAEELAAMKAAAAPARNRKAKR